jgi:hypothetical protein
MRSREGRGLEEAKEGSYDRGGGEDGEEREGETSRQEMMVYFVGIGGGRSRRIKGICLRETAGERD